MRKLKISGATIPYQLRPRKAIERNLFVDLLKRLTSFNKITFNNYVYVGFGAAYLEDFKQMHIELGIIDMECIEMDLNAFTRQKFNNPYHFVNIYNVSSTEYIDQSLKAEKNQIIWLDYSMPKMLRQQLTDIEMLCIKLKALDIVKFTFNSNLKSFISTHQVKNNKGNWCSEIEIKTILQFLKKDDTFYKYLPEDVQEVNIFKFDTVLRAMAVRAINRGLSLSGKNLKFHHLTAFTYADGQEMTTITGIISNDEDFSELIYQSKLQEWPFYRNEESDSEIIESVEIAVPDMTVSERIMIDKKIPSEDIETVAKELVFTYGTDMDEHIYLLKGYHTFYKYLPYFSKVIY